MNPQRSGPYPKVSPYFDVAFQMLFNEEQGCRLLISLLNALLQRPPKARITELTLLPTRRHGLTVDSKFVVMDLLAVTALGERFNLDVQIAPFPDYEARILHYWAGLYHGQLETGKPYGHLRPTVGVHLLGYNLLVKERAFHSTFELRERHRHSLLTDHLALHIIELPKFQQALTELTSEESKWLHFLKHGDTMSAAEAESLGIPEIAEAERKLCVISQEQEVRIQHLRWERAVRDELSIQPGWIKVGREEGLKEGLKLGRQDGLKEGLKDGLKLGRQDGLKDGLKLGVRDLCEALNIPLSPERLAHLDTLDVDSLDALRDRLKRTRSFED